MAMPEAEGPPAQSTDAPNFDLFLLSDIGNDRANNEDACGHFTEGPSLAAFAVADGIGGYEGGEIASRMAVDITLQAFKESPAAWGIGKRLNRAVQQANIEIHNRAITVPELRRMGTTLTAVAISDGVLTAAHVGDCRLYHIRGPRITQMTKDHTVIGERVRMGLMNAKEARNHPERSALTRSVGRELIVSVDRISMPLANGDTVILCSDGLYSVLEDRQLADFVEGRTADEGCKKLIDAANQRGTADNLTAAVFRLHAGAPAPAAGLGWRGRLLRFIGRGR